MTDTFEITNDHITLLQAAEWEYSDCEFGAPAMNPKRPYGNSSVLLDLAELLIPEFKDMSDDDQQAELEDERDRLISTHRELVTVLTVATSAQSFTPGIYQRGDDGWRLVPAQKILDLPMPDGDELTPTIRAYLIALLASLWLNGEGFSGKRPLGNSGWQFDLYVPLIRAGLIAGRLDEDGYVEDCDDDAGARIIASVIRSLSEDGQPR